MSTFVKLPTTGEVNTLTQWVQHVSIPIESILHEYSVCVRLCNVAIGQLCAIRTLSIELVIINISGHTASLLA
jgi:hypothetical protein